MSFYKRCEGCAHQHYNELGMCIRCIDFDKFEEYPRKKVDNSIDKLTKAVLNSCYGMKAKAITIDKNTFEPNKVELGIKKVIFNDPATVVIWGDGNKTVVKCSEYDSYDPEKGLAMAICKKVLGEKQYKNVFKTWSRPEEEKEIAKQKADFEKFIDAWNECGLITPLTTTGSTFSEPEDGVDAY